MPRKLRTHTSICVQCKKDVVKINRLKDPARFCDKSCANAWGHANGLRRTYCGDKTTSEWWEEKYDAAEVERRKLIRNEKMRISSSRPWLERYDEETLDRVMKAAERTWEEIHGINHAKAMKAVIRQKALDNPIMDRMEPEARRIFLQNKTGPMRGKKHTPKALQRMREIALKSYRDGRRIDPKSGRGKAGFYKDHLFRSVYEYAYLKLLEAHGYHIHNDVEYESFRIPYMNEKNHLCTYVPDFFIKATKTMVEVKPKKRLDEENVQRKFIAAKKYCAEHGLIFVIVTENELAPFMCRFDKVRADPDVKLIIRNSKEKMI